MSPSRREGSRRKKASRSNESAARAFDVLVLVASAGGESAILGVLSSLPKDFDLPILVMQHLAPGSSVVNLYRNAAPFAFEWVGNGSALSPRKVLVCPPRSFVELLPDGTCHLTPCAGGAMERPMNRLLASVARSFAHRAIAVVLTGMNDDGAGGARELHDAGGRVVVQSLASAQSPEMPRAAIASGAADLIVPLAEVAQVLSEIVAGTPRPQARSELEAIGRIFGDNGEIAARAREIDWSLTWLGSVDGWPPELRMMARTAVESAHPTAVWWGPDLVQIYNEPWRQFLGASKHPDALGRPARETWPEIWDDIGPMVERVMKLGVAVGGEDHRIVIDRHGYPEEVYFTFAYSPIRDASGAVVGVYHTASETTARVVAERRIAALRGVASQIAGSGAPREACERAARALSSAPLDLPFVLLYLVDKTGRQATLAGAAGVAAGSAAAPHTIRIGSEPTVWPLQRVVTQSSLKDGVLLHDLAVRLPELALQASAEHERFHPHSAFLVPLRLTDAPPSGVLIAALSPYRPFDDAYRSFCELIAQQVNAGMVEATAKQLEHERAERLAELDRAKTEFFANVSHEFRTPLTLLLTPLEEILRRRDELPKDLAAEIEVAGRHSRRLLRLVNDLLDFSEIEARRQRAVLEPTDLGALTTDIASAFRAAIEAAGLRLRVTVDPKLRPVPVNREMWEKIVSNLLSNALKFTFKGEIAVSLRALSLHAEIVVSDTGGGIPEHELPNLFKRFHRVRGTKARTGEGSGIGLAIVHDLVTRMGGQLTVRSIEHRGTSFTIWLPYKQHGHPVGTSAAPAVQPPATRVVADLAGEAARWVASASAEPDGVADDLLGVPPELPARSEPKSGRVIVVDDNADLRGYLRRLLSPRWDVEVAADGAAALELTRRLRPDIVLADVMLPGLDGLALLKEIRRDPDLRYTPVILLTAHAGEEAAIQGLVAGADDYVAKPFSPRELVARVRGQIELGRMRRRAAELNAFLVRFSDAVRGLTDPRKVAETACRMVVEQLGADRAHWADIDWSTHEWVVESGFVRDGVADTTAGRRPLEEWEAATETLLSGRTSMDEDTQSDPSLPAAVRKRWADLGVVARLVVPVMADGKLCALQAVHQCSARRWTPEEIALVEGIAARCWAEVVRTRAEEALARELVDTKRLQAISSALVDQRDPDALYREIVGAAIGLMQSDAASLQTLGPENDELHLAAFEGFDAESAAHWRRVTVAHGSTCGIALRKRCPIMVADVERSPDVRGCSADLEAYRRNGIVAVQSTPLVARDGRVVGMISTHWRRRHEPSDRDLARFDVLARLAADVIVVREQLLPGAANEPKPMRATNGRAHPAK